jgi:hypothetical protein
LSTSRAGFFESGKQRGRPRDHIGATCFPQRRLRDSAAEHADGRDASLSRRGRIVGRVADRDGIDACNSEFPENDLKDVWRGFGLLDILGRGSLVDQVGDGGDVEVLAELVLLGGGRDGNPYAGIAHASKQIGDRREGADQRQVLGLETRAAPFLHFLAVVPLFVSRKEYGNELVAALPDLSSHLLEADVVTELRHRFVPGERMEIDGVQQRPVQVEDGGFRHQFKHAKTCSRRSSDRHYFRRDRGARRSPLGRWLARRLGRTRHRTRACSRRSGLWSCCCIAVLLRTWLRLLRAAILPTRTLCLLWRSSLLRPSVLSLGSACLLVKGMARCIVGRTSDRRFVFFFVLFVFIRVSGQCRVARDHEETPVDQPDGTFLGDVWGHVVAPWVSTVGDFNVVSSTSYVRKAPRAERKQTQSLLEGAERFRSIGAG